MDIEVVKFWVRFEVLQSKAIAFDLTLNTLQTDHWPTNE